MIRKLFNEPVSTLPAVSALRARCLRAIRRWSGRLGVRRGRSVTLKGGTSRSRPQAFAVAVGIVWSSYAIAAPWGDHGGADPVPDMKSTPSSTEEEPGPDGWHREGLALKNGTSRIELAGYLQADFRDFDWAVQGDDTGTERRPGHELRRLRMGSKAWFGDLALVFVIDPRESKKGSRLKDVTAGYSFSKSATVLAGYFKPSIGREFLDSSSKTDFVDRSMAANKLSPDRDWGIELSGSFDRLSYAIGGFAGDGDSNPESSRAAVAGRLILKPLNGLEVAGSLMRGEVRAGPANGTTSPLAKGAEGETPTGFSFWGRPFVQGTRRRLGGDLAYSRGPFRVKAEYLEIREERKAQGMTGLDLADVRGRGWNCQVSYVLTGETKFETVSPRKSIFKGGRGALELVARVEGLRFDDTGVSSRSPSLDSRAGDLLPSGSLVAQAGANYWASTFMKLQGIALWEGYSDARIAPVPGNTGRYFSLAFRVQFMVP